MVQPQQFLAQNQDDKTKRCITKTKLRRLKTIRRLEGPRQDSRTRLHDPRPNPRTNGLMPKPKPRPENIRIKKLKTKTIFFSFEMVFGRGSKKCKLQHC